MFLLPVLSVVLATVDGGPISSTFDVAPRILHGIPAEPGQFPSVVRLAPNGFGICGGHVLSESWILTVAHCVSSPNRTTIEKVHVFTGVTKVAEQGEPLEVERIIVHPNYLYNDHVLLNDIALIKLKEPLSWSSRVQPMAKFARTHMEEELTAVGYGIGSKDHLSWIKVKTIPCGLPNEQYVCVESINPESKICNGDSGSPLINENDELVGLLSHGRPSKKGVCGSVKYYTKPIFYLNWIKEVTNIQSIIVS